MGDRTFTNHGHYFVLEEPSLWMENPDGTKTPVAWNKTHIITQKCAMSGDYGMQIKRFCGYGKSGRDWCMAENPYAGVYLLPEEWAQIFKTLAIHE